MFAAYTYYATHEVGQISYSYETQKVFDPTNLSNFKLYDSSGKQITSAVYATNLVIWNSGNLSLSERSDRIREPIKVTLDGAIQYFIINKVNLVEPENFDVKIAPDNKSITLKWKFFDPSQAIRLTIVHSESSTPFLSLSGRFFQTSIKKIDNEKPKPDFAGVVDKFPKLFLALGIFLLVLGILFGVYAYKRPPREAHIPQSRWARPYFIAGLCFLEGLLISLLAILISFVETHPPI
jgi:hypothetical protein